MKYLCVVLIIVLSAPAQASNLPSGWHCGHVMRAVSILGEATAEAIANAKGWSHSQIEAARACVRRGNKNERSH